MTDVFLSYSRRDADHARQLADYLRHYHETSMRSDVFRGDPNGVWRAPTALNGGPVADLQDGLKGLGFLPGGPVDGLFGYRTLAVVRLFQGHAGTVGG